MDRFVHSLVEASREAGYHVLLFAGEPRDPMAGYDDPAAIDGRRRVRRHRHLPRQPAGDLARAGGRRSSPSVGRGTTRRPSIPGSTSTEQPAPTWRPPTSSDRGHTRGSPGSAGAGLPSSARTAAPGWSRALHARGLPPPVSPPAWRTPWPAAARAKARCCSTRRSPRPSSAPRTRWPWGAAHARAAGLAAGRDVAVVGFDDSPGGTRSCHRGSPPCASRWRSPSRSSRVLEGCSPIRRSSARA